MAIEKKWSAFGPTAITADGTTEGQIFIPDTCGLYVKQKVRLISDTSQIVNLEIKRVRSSTEIVVGPSGQNINTCSDVSSMLVADNATLRADEQAMNHIPPADIQQAIYEREPIVAERNILVDCYGDFYTRDNPLPVDANVTTNSYSNPEIVNFAVVDKDTEESFTFPAGTRRAMIKVRTPRRGNTLQYSWILNESGTNFISVESGNREIFEASFTAARTIYFQTQKNNSVVEIQYWT